MMTEQVIKYTSKTRRSRINKITVIPWITTIFVSLSGQIFFETPYKSMMIWGAIGNSGWFLIWMLFLRFWPSNKSSSVNEVLSIKRSYPWIVAGLICISFFIFLMGPGIQF